ncbi:hypothetical protein SM39_2125 [Serratia marcescens SM39]|uniref:Uncharacterized protein n=1 Tax=Serratia marcescens SM39 TaxID=1334564 RepID=A0AAT9E0R0_SERMA|nr:hypothetical protein SM39_2125 [Serratia marcescens SM39]
MCSFLGTLLPEGGLSVARRAAGDPTSGASRWCYGLVLWSYLIRWSSAARVPCTLLQGWGCTLLQGSHWPASPVATLQQFKTNSPVEWFTCWPFNLWGQSISQPICGLAHRRSPVNKNIDKKLVFV